MAKKIDEDYINNFRGISGDMPLKNSFPEKTDYSAGVLIGAGAGMVVSTGLTVIEDFEAGLVIVNEAKILITQINTARLQVAFSIKSVVLR